MSDKGQGQDSNRGLRLLPEDFGRWLLVRFRIYVFVAGAVAIGCLNVAAWSSGERQSLLVMTPTLCLGVLALVNAGFGVRRTKDPASHSRH